jgi:hypothetical protein
MLGRESMADSTMKRLYLPSFRCNLLCTWARGLRRVRAHARARLSWRQRWQVQGKLLPKKKLKKGISLKRSRQDKERCTESQDDSDEDLRTHCLYLVTRG